MERSPGISVDKLCSGRWRTGGGDGPLPLGGTNVGGYWTSGRSETADDKIAAVRPSADALVVVRRNMPHEALALSLPPRGARTAGNCRSVSLTTCCRSTSYDAAAAASGARRSQCRVRLQGGVTRPVSVGVGGGGWRWRSPPAGSPMGEATVDGRMVRLCSMLGSLRRWWWTSVAGPVGQAISLIVVSARPRPKLASYRFWLVNAFSSSCHRSVNFRLGRNNVLDKGDLLWPCSVNSEYDCVMNVYVKVPLVRGREWAWCLLVVRRTWKRSVWIWHVLWLGSLRDIGTC